MPKMEPTRNHFIVKLGLSSVKNDETNASFFGYLYPRVKLSGTCPAGWRVPWYITIDEPKGRILQGFGGVGTEVMAIRCVKDD